VANLDPAIENILDELKTLVLIGMSGKTLDIGVEDALRATMRPKIQARLDNGGDWELEKDNPLICARHMGAIAKLLSTTNTVSLNVARAALLAIQNDEHCTKGAVVGGDWCA